MNHQAIYRAYPNAVKCLEEAIGDQPAGVFDADGNEIQVDQSLVDAAAVEVAAEFAAEDLRLKRNQLLAETDYLALSDSTLTDEMRTYRQALRDLPANTADPANPVWPTKPGGTN